MSRKVELQTTLGTFTVELYDLHAPRTCNNFAELAKRGYYNSTPVHRVIKDFMIQAGDPTGTGRGGESIYGKNFEDEIHPELKHTGETFHVAFKEPLERGQIIRLAAFDYVVDQFIALSSKFFVTLAPTPWLDGKHAIFGRVSSGLSVVKRLGNIATDATDRPTVEVKIIRAVPI